MQISLYSVFIGILIIVILFMIAATRRNIDQPGAKEVLTALVLVIFALLFFNLSLLVTGKIRFLFHELKFLTLAFLAPCTLSIYLAFTGNSGLLSIKNKLLLCLIPALTVILALTNDRHHFFRAEMFITVYNNVSYVDVVSSWWYWVYSAYSYVLYFVGISVLAVNYYKRPPIYRNQIGLMIVTSVAAIAVNAAVILRLVTDQGDIGLVLCAVVCMVQYITIVKYSRKIVITKARNLVVGDIDSLVLIYDHKGRLLYSNKVAERFCETLKLLSGREYDGKELYIPESNQYFSVSDKKMFDEKGMFTGRVVVLNDITGLKSTVNELEYITTHDYPTGLMNRQAYYRRLRGLGEADKPAALICVSVLGMNLINNIFGYEYGDKIIMRLAGEIRRLAGPGHGNSCARLDGNEMGILLCNAGESEARRFIENLRNRLMGSNDIDLETGFTVIESNSRNAEQLFTDLAETIRRDDEQNARPVSSVFFASLQNSLMLLRDKSGQRFQKITELCSRVAENLSLSGDQKEKLILLSTMADIGLLSASPSVVQNVGSLTNDQWEEMKLHTVKGHNIAFSLPEISCIAKEILSHHERYDGYGYPRGLKGDEIPLLARIFSAVEFFADAPSDQAAKLLLARRGTQFDPAVADAVLKSI